MICVRSVENEQFTADVGQLLYLAIPDDCDAPSPAHAVLSDEWYNVVRHAAVWHNEYQERRGDILFIVHGYNNNAAEVLKRHRRLKQDLATQGFRGIVVSFDWPSGSSVLGYVQDRIFAKKQHSSSLLVGSLFFQGIKLLIVNLIFTCSATLWELTSFVKPSMMRTTHSCIIQVGMSVK